MACLDGVATETITIPSGESVDVLRFESAGQSLVIDGSLTVNELSTLDGQITVNGSLNGVGDIVIANFAEVSGTITGLVTVANGAQLFFLDGAISGTSTVLTNLGVVVVDGPGLLLDNGVTVDNVGLWEFFTGDTSGDGDADQTLLISVPDSSTFNNDGVVRKVGDGLTVLQGGFEFNMGDGSAIRWLPRASCGSSPTAPGRAMNWGSTYSRKSARRSSGRATRPSQVASAAPHRSTPSARS